MKEFQVVVYECGLIGPLTLSFTDEETISTTLYPDTVGWENLNESLFFPYV